MIKRIFKHVFKFAVYLWDLEFSVKLKKNSFHRHAVRASFVVIPLALAYFLAFSELTPPHQFSSAECFNCHMTVPSKGDPRPYMFILPIHALCTVECHSDLNPVSHYDNPDTDETYETVFPVLYPDEITCATCHDPHMPAVDPNTGEKTYFLRNGVKGKEECMLCHTEAMPSHDIFTLLPMMDRAHGVANFTVLDRLMLDYSDRHLLGVIEAMVALDDLSIFCLNCHDDPGIPDMTMPGSEIYAHGPDTGLSHPIGINYEDAAMNNNELKLADRDPRILLFDGKIGCCSCHDPYEPGVSMGLRIGDSADFRPLCMGCHMR